MPSFFGGNKGACVGGVIFFFFCESADEHFVFLDHNECCVGI